MTAHANFLEYSAYYDLINTGKDYSSEADYVAGLLSRYAPAANTLLELGCGTGNHAALLSSKGFRITGVEKSDGMAELARLKWIPDFDVITGDMTALSLTGTFDCAISLFHVMSYLNTDDDLFAVFNSVHKLLNPAGLFIFDVWYTPAVYAQRAEKRTRNYENDLLTIERTAFPVIDEINNIVDVNYTLNVLDKLTEVRKEIHERHSMRHFSIPEMRLFAKISGFTILSAEEFLTGKLPGTDTWGVCLILQKDE